MIILDMELSGLDSRRNSILSIGAVDFSNPDNQFYTECRLRKYGKFHPDALAVNGFTEESIRDRKKPSEDAALEKLCAWMDKIPDRTIAGHNVQTDIRFLKHAFYKYGIERKITGRSVDTYGLVYVHMLLRGVKPPMRESQADINSDVVFSYCGLPKEPHPHNALTGVKMIAESLSRLLYGKCMFGEFSRYEIPGYLRQGIPVEKDRKK